MINPPLLLLVAIIPSVLYLRLLHIPCDLATYNNQPNLLSYDLFTWGKAALLLCLTIASLAFTNFSTVPKRLTCPLISYSLLLLISALYSNYPMLAVFGTPDYNEGLLVLLAYPVIFLASTQSPKRYLIPTLQTSLFLVAFFCLLQITFRETWLDWFAGASVQAIPFPLYGALMNPNHLGLYCATLYPIIFLSKVKFKEICFSWLLLAIAMGTGSRLALTSITVTTLILLWHKFDKRKQLVLGFAILILGAFLSKSLHTSFKDRWLIYKKAVPMISHTLLFGAGPATFINEFPQHTPEIEHLQGNRIVDRPHNIYLQVAHASGLLSLLVLGFVVILSIFQAKEIELRASVIGFLIAGLFTDSMVGVTPIFLFILGQCWARGET